MSKVRLFRPDDLANPITGITFDWTTHRREAEGTDNFPLTWDADGEQYASGGDGFGWSGLESPKTGLSYHKITGDKDTYTGSDQYYPGTENCGDLCGKSYGIIALGGAHYKWLSPNSGVENWDSATLYKSTDKGVNWSAVSPSVQWLEADGVGVPCILQFGQDYAGARDGYVYVYWTVIKDGTVWENQVPGEILLSRVPLDDIETQGSYEWFTGTADSPSWGTLASANPVIQDARGLMRNSAIWHPGTERYIVVGNHTERNFGNIVMWESGNPWGPFTSFFDVEDWPSDSSGSPHDPVPQNQFYGNFSPKWWSGLDGVFVWTGKTDNDAWNSVECTLQQ